MEVVIVSRIARAHFIGGMSLCVGVLVVLAELSAEPLAERSFAGNGRQGNYTGSAARE
jgi:hypothetical protein